MSEHLNPDEQQYTHVLHRYTLALEQGDIETVTAILHDAEQDSALEQVVLMANSTYQDEQGITIASREVKQAHAMLLNTFSSQQDEHFNRQESGKQSMQTQETIPQKAERLLSYPSKRTRLHRFRALAQTLVAVLVIGALVSGFALLFASRHQTTTGSSSLGTGGHATLARSVVVTSTDDGTVYGLRPDTSAIAWHYATGKSLVNGSSTFAVHGQVVYFAARGQLYALRATNGTLLWHKNLDFPKAEQTNYHQIVVDKGVVFVSGQVNGVGVPGGNIYALREHDGAIIWQYQSSSNPLLAVHNGVVYAVRVLDDQGNEAIQALRGSDGSYLWHYNTNVIAAVADDNAVYVYSGHSLSVPGEVPGSKKQYKSLLALSTKGTLLWSKPVLNDGIAPLVMAHSAVLLGGIDENPYRVCAYRTSDGSRSWCTPTTGVSSIYDKQIGYGLTLYTVLGDTVYSDYSVPQNSDVVQIEARATSSGTLRWSAPLVTQSLQTNTMIVMNNIVYVLADHKIYALDDSNGHIYWQLLNSANTFTAFAVGSW